MRTFWGLVLLVGAAPALGATPCVITTGGLYSNLVCESNDANVPAVSVDTTASVIIEKALINHKGMGLFAAGMNGYQIAIINSKFTALDPGIAISQRAIYIERPSSLRIEHNSLLDGHGILIDGDPDEKDRLTQLVKVRLNDITNIGRYGRPPDVPDRSNRIQFLQVHGGVYADLEVAWNRVSNFYGESDVEDNINFYKASGKPTRPLDIHHNLIDGAWPALGDDVALYNGGGILIGDGDQFQAGSFGNVHDNRVINTGNYGIAISGGSDNVLFGNRVISDAKSHTGTPVARADAAGMTITNDYGGIMVRTTAYGNSVALVNPSYRSDWWLSDCNPSNACTGNISLPTPTTVLEQAERAAWEKELAANQLTVGPNW